MRVLVVPDIHPITALETVPRWPARSTSDDRLWAAPERVWPMACNLAKVMIGNHDLACPGKVDLSDFNRRARQISGTASSGGFNRAVLDALPPSLEVDERFLVATAARASRCGEYLLAPQAEDNFCCSSSRFAYRPLVSSR
jgi:hypothetical protein